MLRFDAVATKQLLQYAPRTRLELQLATVISQAVEEDRRVTAVDGVFARLGRTPRTLLAITVTGLLLRLLLVLWNFHDLPASAHFEQFGAEMGWTARSLASGFGFSSPFFPRTGPTALVPPLFPLLLAGIFKLFGLYTEASAFVALSLSSVLSTATAVVLFFGLQRRFGFRVARLAAWIWALHPYAMYYSAVYLWDCALTSLLFACCFFLALNLLPAAPASAWGGWGLLMGAAALSNPSVLTLAPVLAGFAVVQRKRHGLPVARRVIVALAMLMLTLLPWCIRNLRVLHEPVLVRDGFWAEFYAGNCGDASHTNPGWTHPASNPAEMREYQRLGETGYMAAKRSLSIQSVRQRPAAFFSLSARRVLRFWTGYWSFSGEYLKDERLDVPNVPLCTGFTLLMIFGSVQLYRRQRSLAAPFLGVFLVFPLPYYVTHASVDYRQPIEPVIVAVIAIGVHTLLYARTGNRQHPSPALHASA